MKMRFDCKYFLGDRPCQFHKKQGVKCDPCQYYLKQGKKILIVKLGSLGDVLRTTFLLRGIKQKFKNSFICWLTEPGCLPLLKENPYIDRVLPYGLESFSRLLVQEFDILINLDIDFRSASLATLIKAKRKMGFGMDRNGKIFAFNSEAKEWLDMSLRDGLKKENKKTYQEHVCAIVGINIEDRRPLCVLTEKEMDFAKDFAEKHNLKAPLIGFNLEAGKRWPKAWPEERFLKLANILNEQLKAKILILRSPDSELNKRFTDLDFVIDAGTHANLREFASLINIIDILLTADTFALHIALAFGKKVVALFGPTSSQEIDLFGKGEKIIAPLDCVCCYQNDCSRTPNCLESITAETVFQTIEKAIA